MEQNAKEQKNFNDKQSNNNNINPQKIMKKFQINMPLSSTNKFTFSSPNYLNTLFTSSIGNDVTFNSPFGRKSVVYADFTASGRGLKEIEQFISSQILPFYANIHSQCGYLAEQSSAFRNEAKSIVRRYCDTDENNSIIFTGQGTTGAIHKLIKLLNLKEYINFYKDLEILNDIYQEFFEGKNEKDITIELKIKFEKINKILINKIKENFRKLFQLKNFCYANRWGGFDCILCRMGFTTETQYNEHENGEIHKNNLKNFKDESDIEKSKMNFIDSISSKYLSNKNDNNYIYDLIKDYQKFLPIIFLSVYEHNSNSLSWRETGAKIVYIKDLQNLKQNLEKYNENFIKMGSFTAASNITGIYLDVDKYSILMHKYNGLAFFDYAAAAPYIKIDMNKKLPDDYRKLLGFSEIINSKDNLGINEQDINLCFKDALFFSPHKFLGGVNTPGVLLIQQRVVRNLLVPSEPGGGVVLFVTKNSQNYVKDIELREESGTPDIIGSVRIGLSLILRERIDHYFILKKEQEINEKIYNKLKILNPFKKNLHILFQDPIPNSRIPIFSFLISFNKKFFHPNYISALLNDIFGIQSRPGCSCASTYGQYLLGIEDSDLKNIEQITCTGKEIFRPGYTRINFPYFYPDYVIDYILDAILYITENAYKFLPLYAFKIESGRFYHRNEDTKKKWLNDILFSNESKIIIPDFIEQKDKKFINKERLDEMMNEAKKLVEDKNINLLRKNVIGKSKINLMQLFENEEKYRWFLIYDDIEYIFPKTKEEFNDKNKLRELIDKCYNDKLELNWDIKEINLDTKIDNIESAKEKIIESNNNKNIINKTENNIFNINIDTIPTESTSSQDKNNNNKNINLTLFPEIPKKISQLVGEASKDFDMLHPNDRILVCVSGGKDSLTLLHVMLNIKRKIPFKIEIGAMTVDPMSEDFDPSPLINYMKSLNVPYFFESDKILDNAKKSLQNDSICSFCARMKRGIIYNCARREKYNVIALGQHLDDIAESFLMSVFHNGILRTMKANYLNDKGDIRIIRPLIYCREKLFKDFALKANLPVIQENCPACFQNPKERQRMKVLLAQQENLFPSLFSSLQKAMIPLMKGNIKDLIKDIKQEGEKCDIKKAKGKKYCSVGDEFDE